ncbi:MAG TPA: hypothetical protein VIN58_05790 [Roseateles sp.]
MATVTEHVIPDDPRNDREHPVPYLNVIDVSAYRKDGGADLTIVVASPLAADERSQTRLLDKIQGYLGHIQSEEFARDAGAPPTPDSTTITVRLHPESSQAIRDLLDRCRAWVGSHGATLLVRNLNADDVGSA